MSPCAYAYRVCEHSCAYASAYAYVVRVNQALATYIGLLSLSFYFVLLFQDPPASNTPATFGTFRGLILRSQLIILLKQKVSACLACRVFIVYTYVSVVTPRVNQLLYEAKGTRQTRELLVYQVTISWKSTKEKN